ncbi:MAG: hypothetical protein E6G81_06715 [Alphaproteobacteria bacterium]|nr:MAG: hypothetical protein E6G81_06715 [Alphaproteobacteria bacterium]
MLRRPLLLLAALAYAAVAFAQTPGDPIPAGAPTLTGRAAQESAPARAFAGLLEAAAKNDFAAIRPMLVEGHPGSRLLNPADFPRVKAELLPNDVPPAIVIATLSALYLQNDDAILVFGVKTGRTIWKMKRQTGSWKLSP